MTVKQLKQIISELPDDMQVVVQKDGEGNGFSPLSDANGNCVYIPKNSYSGEAYDLILDANHYGFDEDEWLHIKEQPKCLLLYPIN